MGSVHCGHCYYENGSTLGVVGVEKGGKEDDDDDNSEQSHVWLKLSDCYIMPLNLLITLYAAYIVIVYIDCVHRQTVW